MAEEGTHVSQIADERPVFRGELALALVAVFFFGNLWFRFVEAIWGRIKRRFTRRKEPPAWHPLPTDREE